MAKTVLSLTPEEWQQYNPTQNLNKFQAPQRWEIAWQLVPRLAELLRSQFGATRVVVFGSLTCKEWFTDWSDIDLAAWGIAPEKFYAAVGAVMEFSSEFSVDLIDPTTCQTSILKSIERRGIEV